jgi:hypothetical protein
VNPLVSRRILTVAVAHLKSNTSKPAELALKRLIEFMNRRKTSCGLQTVLEILYRKRWDGKRAFHLVVTSTMMLVLLQVYTCGAVQAANTEIVNAAAPVSLQSCEAFSEKVVLTWSGKVVPFGKLSPFDVDDRNTTSMRMHLGASFTNDSFDDVSAVRIAFAGFDNFGDQKALDEGTYRGTFSHSVLIERTKTGALEASESPWFSDVALVKCAIVAVSFANGTVWKVSDSKSQSVATAPVTPVADGLQPGGPEPNRGAPSAPFGPPFAQLFPSDAEPDCSKLANYMVSVNNLPPPGNNRWTSTLINANRVITAVKVCGGLDAHVATAPYIKTQYAIMLGIKGFALAKLGQPKEATALYDEAISRLNVELVGSFFDSVAHGKIQTAIDETTSVREASGI